MNKLHCQLIIKILRASTHNGFFYLKKIGNYQQNLEMVTKNNGINQNRDNIDNWFSWFYSSNFLIWYGYNTMKLDYKLYICVVNYFWIFIQQHIYLSSKIRVIKKFLRKRKIMVYTKKPKSVNSWISWFYSLHSLFDKTRLNNTKLGYRL